MRISIIRRRGKILLELSNQGGRDVRGMLHAEENEYKALVEKPAGKGPTGTPKCRCEHNNKVDLK